jgi:hypothetical protein
VAPRQHSRTTWSRVRRGDDGMTTAEYAVGTVAACAFGGALYKLVTSSSVAGMLSDLLQRALNVF